MATKTQLLNNWPSNLDAKIGAALPPTPFRVYIVAVNDDDKSADVRISRYSSVLSSPDINDRLTLIGIDVKLNLKYPEKLWLEIFYDKNLSPVFGIVNKGVKWPARVVDTAHKDETLEIYPKEHEFITKADLEGKTRSLSATLALVNQYERATSAELHYRRNTGVIADNELSALQTAATNKYSEIRAVIYKYANSMNRFFDAAPSAVWRKLFRTYTLIAYTTHDKDTDLEGSVVRPKISAETATQAGVNKATLQTDYKIVQCLNTDLYLTEICYQNRYPARLAMPFHRPVYYFNDAGKVEETTNTK